MDAGNANFFLINLDGSVTPATAMAGLASGGPAVDRLTLNEALGLNPDQVEQFIKWLDLVRLRYRELRWEKLTPLAPISEIKTGPSEEDSLLRLIYRKMEDRDGNLTAILVIGIDAAPNRAMVQQIEDERLRHKLEMRDLLALSANPPETLGAFLEDARKRLEKVRNSWDGHLAIHKNPSSATFGPWQETAEENIGQLLFRELHMVKGNAGAFGFDGLAAMAQEAEDLLAGLKKAGARSPKIILKLTSSLNELRTQLEEIHRALKLIAGEGQDAMTRILKWKMDRLGLASSEIKTAGMDPPLRNFIESTRSLAFLSPAYLVRKYRNLVERIAMNQGKHIHFRVTSNTGDIHPECFSRVDEALVHILRNMVDHGIETPEEREAAEKGDAEIGLEYVNAEDRIFLRIRDNGRGMDPDTILKRGLKLGLVKPPDAEQFDDTAKLGLIFMEGFTTRSTASLLSGRGLGLSLAARCIADQGGNIYVYSKLGEGARFAIELPHLGHKNLPG
jgi:HPt (histidine-containing phosphotransfer) domain-containing protein